MSRVYNFAAGPAVLPLEVLQEAKDDLLDYKGCGMSVMEMSHRSKVFDDIIKEAEARNRSKVPIQLDLFTDYEALAIEQEKKDAERDKERKMQEALIAIKHKFGKKAILKGTSFSEGATARDRNNQIGGHKA